MTTMTANHMHAIRSSLIDLTDAMRAAHDAATNRSLPVGTRTFAREAWLVFQEAANDAEMALPAPLREEPDGY